MDSPGSGAHERTVPAHMLNLGATTFEVFLTNAPPSVHQKDESIYVIEGNQNYGVTISAKFLEERGRRGFPDCV